MHLHYIEKIFVFALEYCKLGRVYLRMLFFKNRHPIQCEDQVANTSPVVASSSHHQSYCVSPGMTNLAMTHIQTITLRAQSHFRPICQFLGRLSWRFTPQCSRLRIFFFIIFARCDENTSVSSDMLALLLYIIIAGCEERFDASSKCFLKNYWAKDSFDLRWLSEICACGNQIL